MRRDWEKRRREDLERKKRPAFLFSLSPSFSVFA